MSRGKIVQGPIYLGDGLYAEDYGYDIRVYASNGIAVYNEVFLDRGMLAELTEFANATPPAVVGDGNAQDEPDRTE